MKLSKSKINTYMKCPLEFKFQYIEERKATEQVHGTGQ